MTDWQGRSVWLVGASSGIGEATASALHARGAHVVVAPRSAPALARFTDAHPGAVALPLDVTQTTLLLVLALLGRTALLACYLPARRATRVAPMVALRNE